jgi:glycosyltransferase involved in cell wall biosynthesis
MKVLHCIPTLQIGGIESMSIRLLSQKFKSINYRVLYFDSFNHELLNLFHCESRKQVVVLPDKHFFKKFFSLIEVLKGLSDDEVIILSTWRSLKIFFILKLLRKKNKIIVFHHRTYPAHIVDRISRKIFYKFVEFHFCDSESTCSKLPLMINRSVVRPFFLAEKCLLQRDYNRFCIMGRIHEHRNLSRALKFFYEIKILMPDAHLDIIGPDAGDLKTVKAVIDFLEINNSVSILSGINPLEILKMYKKYDFIISTPISEGMGMSIAEAMSAGVIPIVGPFGEPAQYCNKENSFLLQSYGDKDLKDVAINLFNCRSKSSLNQISLKATMITNTMEPCATSLESNLFNIL